MLEKPLYFDNYRKGALYREFETLDDIRQTTVALDALIAWDLLFQDAHFIIDESLRKKTTYKTAVLTAWVLHETGRVIPEGNQITPVSLDDLIAFGRKIFLLTSPPYAIADDAKAAFLSWISGITGRDRRTVEIQMGAVFEDLFSELEQEYGTVLPEAYDSRFMPHFLIF